MKKIKNNREASLLFNVSSLEPELRISSTSQKYCIWRHSDTKATVSCNGVRLGTVKGFGKIELEVGIDRLILHQEEYSRETVGLH